MSAKERAEHVGFEKNESFPDKTASNSEEKPMAAQTIEKSNEIAPELDVTKETFDPLKALYTKDLRISKKPPAVHFQNLAAFGSALKRHGLYGLQKIHEKPEASTSKTTKTNSETAIRRFLPHQMPIKSTTGSYGVNKRHNKNLLKWFNKLEGPLKLLTEAMTSHRRVRVTTRNEHGVRGYIEGTIICFDKHWNILLRDALEVWTRRKFKYGVNKTCAAGNATEDCTQVLAELGIQLPNQTIKSINRKNVQITRELAQIMVRGEQIVLVNVIARKIETE